MNREEEERHEVGYAGIYSPSIKTEFMEESSYERLLSTNSYTFQQHIAVCPYLRNIFMIAASFYLCTIAGFFFANAMIKNLFNAYAFVAVYTALTGVAAVMLFLLNVLCLFYRWQFYQRCSSLYWFLFLVLCIVGGATEWWMWWLAANHLSTSLSSADIIRTNSLQYCTAMAHGLLGFWFFFAPWQAGILICRSVKPTKF